MESNERVLIGNHWNKTKNSLKDFLNSCLFSDITLVSDDMCELKAHKFMLCAFSSVFRKILVSVTESNHSLIFLKGVQHQEIVSVMELIYYGEATINKNRIADFMDFATYLEINDVVLDNVTDQECQTESKEEFLEEINPQEKGESDGFNDVLIHDETGKEKKYQNINDDEDFVDASNQRFWECENCHKILNTKSGYWYHMKSQHNLAQFKCPECRYRTSHHSHLKRHIRSRHGGIKYPCKYDDCDHESSREDNLRKHFRLKHQEA